MSQSGYDAELDRFDQYIREKSGSQSSGSSIPSSDQVECIQVDKSVDSALELILKKFEIDIKKKVDILKIIGKLFKGDGVLHDSETLLSSLDEYISQFRKSEIPEEYLEKAIKTWVDIIELENDSQFPDCFKHYIKENSIQVFLDLVGIKQKTFQPPLGASDCDEGFSRRFFDVVQAIRKDKFPSSNLSILWAGRRESVDQFTSKIGDLTTYPPLLILKSLLSEAVEKDDLEAEINELNEIMVQFFRIMFVHDDVCDNTGGNKDLAKVFDKVITAKKLTHSDEEILRAEGFTSLFELCRENWQSAMGRLVNLVTRENFSTCTPCGVSKKAVQQKMTEIFRRLFEKNHETLNEVFKGNAEKTTNEIQPPILEIYHVMSKLLFKARKKGLPSSVKKVFRDKTVKSDFKSMTTVGDHLFYLINAAATYKKEIRLGDGSNRQLQLLRLSYPKDGSFTIDLRKQMQVFSSMQLPNLVKGSGTEKTHIPISEFTHVFQLIDLMTQFNDSLYSAYANAYTALTAKMTEGSTDKFDIDDVDHALKGKDEFEKHVQEIHKWKENRANLAKVIEALCEKKDIVQQLNRMIETDLEALEGSVERVNRKLAKCQEKKGFAGLDQAQKSISDYATASWQRVGALYFLTRKKGLAH